MTVGERIKSLREKKGLSQEELGDSIKVSRQNIYKYETGIVTNIPIDKIDKLAKFFCVTPAYIVGWQEPSQNVDFSNSSIKQSAVLSPNAVITNDLTDIQKELLELFEKLTLIGKAEIILQMKEKIERE